MAGGGVTEFAPFAYLWGTLTVWHMALWLAFPVMIGVVLPLRANEPIIWKVLPIALIMGATFYGIFALIFGQIFGDKYTWSQLWPSGALLGGSFGALIFVPNGSSKQPPFAFSLIGVAVAAAVYTICMWLFPRIAGFGLFDFPKLSWGVHL